MTRAKKAHEIATVQATYTQVLKNTPSQVKKKKKKYKTNKIKQKIKRKKKKKEKVE